MKTVLSILFILTTQLIYATPELSSKFYRAKNIEIELIIRYRDNIQELYYEALIKNLDGYISKLKANGKLVRGKVHLEIMVAMWMDHAPGIEMYRYKTGYYCSLNGLVQPITQKYLLEILTYFSADSWQSFCYDYDKVRPATALRIFNTRLDTLSVKEDFPDREALKLNWITVVLRNDDLICKSSTNEYGTIKRIIPFSNTQVDCYVIEKTVLS